MEVLDFLVINIIKFKAKDLEMEPYPLCSGKCSKYFTIDSMKKTGLNGYVNDISVNHIAIIIW